MLRRPNVLRLTPSPPRSTKSSHRTFSHRHHQPLSIRPAVRPTTRGSHHPHNLPQVYPPTVSPSASKRNSTLSTGAKMTPSSKRIRFVRRVVETAALSSVLFGTYYYYTQTREVSSDPRLERRTFEIEDVSNPYVTKRKVLQLLTPEECTVKLQATEESFIVNRGNGVYRYDVNQLASNNPIEDDHKEQIIEAPTRTSEAKIDDWMFWGIFDGHVGWYTSDVLKQLLIPYVVRELSTLYKSPSPPSSSAVDDAIKRGFTALDDDIVLNATAKVLKNPSKRLAADILLPAHSGSCALLTFFDSVTRRLKVACTGDSRAILGRKDPDSGKWTVQVLSVDQTGQNVEEANRLRREHPGEEKDVVKRGRVLGGLEPTRAVYPSTPPSP
jgi:serine/threonine protein phosphatase PrpC